TTYIWGRPNAYPQYAPEGMANDGANGPAIVVELQEAEYTHAKQWFDHRKNPADGLYGTTCGAACMDYIGNIEVGPGADGTNTLRAISPQDVQNLAAGKAVGKAGNSALVPSGKKLFDVL